MTKRMFEIKYYFSQKGDNIELHFPHNKKGKCNLHISA